VVAAPRDAKPALDLEADWITWLHRSGCHAMAGGAAVTAQDVARLSCELSYVRWSLRDWLKAYAYSKPRFDKLLAKPPIVGTSKSAQCRILLRAYQVEDRQKFLAACEREIARWESRLNRTAAMIEHSPEKQRASA